MKDYYKILELSYGASISEIRQAFRKLAHRYHPDKNKNSDASEMFIKITEAFETLRYEHSKRMYDKLYVEFYHNNKQDVTTLVAYQKSQSAWENAGRDKAKEYSEMPFELFSRRVLAELRAGSKYIINIVVIAMFSVLMLLFVGMTLKESSLRNSNSVVGLIFIAAIMILVYFLFKVMRKDYLEERKRMINRK